MKWIKRIICGVFGHKRHRYERLIPNQKSHNALFCTRCRAVMPIKEVLK